MDRAKADIVLARLTEGASLRKAAAAAGLHHSSVQQWLDDDEEFSRQYAQARARGYQLLADEIIEISDESSGDVIETEDGPRHNPEYTARSRLRVDSRKWMLSKMIPKVYGEKIQHTGDPENPVALEFSWKSSE
jgi:hypothetical protein